MLVTWSYLHISKRYKETTNVTSPIRLCTGQSHKHKADLVRVTQHPTHLKLVTNIADKSVLSIAGAPSCYHKWRCSQVPGVSKFDDTILQDSHSRPRGTLHHPTGLPLSSLHIECQHTLPLIPFTAFIQGSSPSLTGRLKGRFQNSPQ